MPPLPPFIARDTAGTEYELRYRGSTLECDGYHITDIGGGRYRLTDAMGDVVEVETDE